AVDLGERLGRYGVLAVRVGANVEEGENVFIQALIEPAQLARALTRAAYRAGARYVDVLYRDDHVRKAMIELGPDEALEHSPEWLKERWRQIPGKRKPRHDGRPRAGAPCQTSLDGTRVGRARMKDVIEIARRGMV